MASIKPLQKTSTDAPMFKYNPTSPGRRHRLIVSKKGLWKGRPLQKLTMRIKSHAGRNNTGQITVRGRQAPHHRRLYRLVDEQGAYAGQVDPGVLSQRTGHKHR